MSRLDVSSFTDKILAAASLASEGSEGEVEFAFTEEALNSSAIKERILNYVERHSREGFVFDGYVNIKTVRSSRSSGRLPLLIGGARRPVEELVRDFLVFLSAMGRIEDLVQYVLIQVKPRPSKAFYTTLEESEDMDPMVKERLSRLESRWAELPEFGRQLLTATFLIENDNSYEIEVEKAEGPLKGREKQTKEIMDMIFRSRLKLVRNFTK